MMTASELADALGRKNIAAAAGVGMTAVSNAVVRGAFPAAWFIVVSNLARQQGADCPHELFNMVTSTSQNLDDAEICQWPRGNRRGASQ